MLIISELRFRKRFENLIRGVYLRKMEFLVLCKMQIISQLKNIERMRIIDFFARVYSQRDKIDICEKISNFAKWAKKAYWSHNQPYS